MTEILRFDKVNGSFSLDPIRPEKIHLIPVVKNPRQPNFIRVKNGKGSFHRSDINHRKFRGTGHGHFWRIPEGATIFRFPSLRKNAGGWHYGEPEWDTE